MKRLVSSPEGQEILDLDEAERDWVQVVPWAVRIASTRYEHEIKGTTFTHSDGSTYGIATDRQSQALTTGAAVQARRAQEAGDTFLKKWKTGQGFVSMSADDILSMGDAVDAHVQACFDREADLLTKVADGTISESDLGTGWP